MNLQAGLTQLYSVVKGTTCSVSTTNSYECTTVIEPFEARTFLVTVTGEAMVDFAKNRHFDRQLMTECLPILRTLGIIDSPDSLREKTSTREGYPIKPSNNKPHPGLSSNSQNNVAFTRSHVHGQRPIFIHWNGFSYLNDNLSSRFRSWISCTIVNLGLHQFSPHMDCSLTWLYSSIS